MVNNAVNTRKVVVTVCLHGDKKNRIIIVFFSVCGEVFPDIQRVRRVFQVSLSCERKLIKKLSCAIVSEICMDWAKMASI